MRPRLTWVPRRGPWGVAFAVLTSVGSATSPAHHCPTCNPAPHWFQPAALRPPVSLSSTGNGVRLSGRKPKHPASALITTLLAEYRSMTLSYGFFSEVFGLFAATVHPLMASSQPARPSTQARLGVPPRVEQDHPAAGTVRARGRAASGYAALRSAVSQAVHQNRIKKPIGSGPACQPSDFPSASLTQSLAGKSPGLTMPRAEGRTGFR